MAAQGPVGDDVRRLVQWPMEHPMQASIAVAIVVFCAAFIGVSLAFGGANRLFVGLAQLVVVVSWLISFLVFKKLQRRRHSLGGLDDRLLEEPSDA